MAEEDSRPSGICCLANDGRLLLLVPFRAAAAAPAALLSATFPSSSSAAVFPFRLLPDVDLADAAAAARTLPGAFSSAAAVAPLEAPLGVLLEPLDPLPEAAADPPVVFLRPAATFFAAAGVAEPPSAFVVSFPPSRAFLEAFFGGFSTGTGLRCSGSFSRMLGSSPTKRVLWALRT